jgi:hypothetical protein
MFSPYVAVMEGISDDFVSLYDWRKWGGIELNYTNRGGSDGGINKHTGD